MTIRHFQIFVTVCDTMNMTAAAERLYMSQPAVSQAVAEMEAHYGVRLFERYAKKLFLTRAGEKLFGYAAHIIRMNGEIEGEMSSMSKSGVLRIGSSVTIGASILPDLVFAYQAQFPDSLIEVTEDNTAAIQSLIQIDKIDLALVEGDITMPDIVTNPLTEDKLILICGPSHPFAKRRVIDPEELSDARFIVREIGSGTRKTFENVMSEHNIGWSETWTCNNADTIKAAVAKGLGISVISRLAVEREIALGLIVPVEIRNLNFKRLFKLVYHKSKYHTATMDAFIDFCYEKVRNPARP